MKGKKSTYYLIALLLMVSLSMFSQGKRRNPPKPAGPPPPHPELPINGGIPYLIITGIAYGVYELKRKK